MLPPLFGSCEAEASKLTGRGRVPLTGLACSAAPGGWLPPEEEPLLPEELPVPELPPEEPPEEPEPLDEPPLLEDEELPPEDEEPLPELLEPPEDELLELPPVPAKSYSCTPRPKVAANSLVSSPGLSTSW